jgi:hypothetical protein
MTREWLGDLISVRPMGEILLWEGGEKNNIEVTQEPCGEAAVISLPRWDYESQV